MGYLYILKGGSGWRVVFWVYRGRGVLGYVNGDVLLVVGNVVWGIGKGYG